MNHYHAPEDRAQIPALVQHAPDPMKALIEFDKQALRGRNKQIPPKYTELMALAVALTTQCPHCIEAHTGAAKQHGATATEIAETVATAAALRAGAALTHGAMAMKFYEAAV